MSQVPFASAGTPVQGSHSSPISNTPIADWVRDGAAVLLLLASLALPWAVSGGSVTPGAGRVEVLLISILSILSIAITYLARFGALGPGLSLGRVVALRAALNVPYGVLVLVYIVIDGVSASGLGASASVGLAGALLAAGTRSFEMKAQPANSPILRASYAILRAWLGMILITSLLGLILPIVLNSNGPIILVTLLLPLTASVALVVVAVSVFRRSDAARLIALGLGVAVLATTLIDASGGFVLTGKSLQGLEFLRTGGYPLLWFASLGALCAAPSVRLSMVQKSDLTVWFVAAKQTLLGVGVFAAVLAVFDVAGIVDPGDSSVGLWVGQLLSQVVIVVAALIARVQLTGNPSGSRMTVLGLTSAIAAVSIVSVVLTIATSQESVGVYGVMTPQFLAPPAWSLIGELGLSTLIAYALLVPASAREYYAQFAPPTPATRAAYPASPHFETAGGLTVAATAPQNVPYPSGSSPTAPPPSPPLVSEAARRAANPSTPADELHRYASDRSLWTSLAKNPALYPEMVEWLRSTGDPEVVALLSNRG